MLHQLPVSQKDFESFFLVYKMFRPDVKPILLRVYKEDTSRPQRVGETNLQPMKMYFQNVTSPTDADEYLIQTLHRQAWHFVVGNDKREPNHCSHLQGNPLH